MPNIRSGFKRMRQGVKRKTRNQAVLSELDTLTKKLHKLADQDPVKAKEYAKVVIKKIDKAAANKYIPANRRDRKKARIAEFINKIPAKKSA